MSNLIIVFEDGKVGAKDEKCECGGRFIFIIWGGLFSYVECEDCRKYETKDCPPWPKKGPDHWCTQYDRLPDATDTEPREDLYTCRLCGNGITLIEHEINKLTVEVQREDLQFLYDLGCRIDPD